MSPICMSRRIISFCVIVTQLSVVSSTLMAEQIQTSSDHSSPPSLFSGPSDSGFTGNLDRSSPEDLMGLFNNGGNFEQANGDKNCAPRPARRGKRRARRDGQTFCDSNLQIITSPNKPQKKPQKAGQQSGSSQSQKNPPKMQEETPKIPGSEDPDTAPILLEQLDVPQPDPSICPWGIASIPICAKPEDSDDSKDILPGMGFISDFIDIVHWNRYDPATGCQEYGETLYCCHFVRPQPILQNPREEHVPEADLSSPLLPFDGWFGVDQPAPHTSSSEKERTRDYTATLCRPGPSADYPGPQRINHRSNH